MPVVRGEPVNRAGAARAVKLASLHAARDARSTPRTTANPLDTGAPAIPWHYTPSRNHIDVHLPTARQGTPVSASYAQAHPHNLYSRNSKGQIIQGNRLGGVGLLGTSVLAQGLTNLGQDAIYHPAGVYDAVRHPLRTAKAVGGNALHLATHPWQDPILAGLALYGGGNALANLPERAAALRAGGLGKALARPVGGSRVLHGPEGAKTLALNSDAPIARGGQRILDRIGQVDKPTGAIPGTRNALQQLRADYGAHRFRVHNERAGRITRNVTEAQASDNSFASRMIGHSHEPVVAPGSSPTVAARGGRAAGNAVMQAVRSLNRVSRAAVLYGKPGYLPPNILGQEFLSATQQGIFSPLRRLEQGHGGLRGSLGDLGNARLNELAGSGIIRSSEPAVGRGIPGLTQVEKVIDKVDRVAGGLTGSILDTPYRRAAVTHELARRGVKGPEDIKRALALLAQHGRNVESGAIRDVIPHGEARKALESGLSGNQAMINYDALGPVTKKARDFVFFTPWLKGASLYGGHMLRDHPLQSLLAAELGKEGMQRANRELGPQPSFAEGTFKVGSRVVKGLGKVPEVVNPQSASILGQPVQLAQTAASMLGLTPNKPGLDPEGYLAPAFYSLLAALTHKDPFTGHQIPQSQGWPQIYGHQFAGMVPAYSQLWKGGAFQSFGGPKSKAQTNPTQTLYPRSAKDAVKQFTFGSIAPRPENPVEQQSRWRAEQTASTSKEGAAKLRADWYRGDLTNRMSINHFGTPGGPINKGIGWQRDLALSRLRVAKMGGNAVGSHGSLTAVGSLAAQFQTYALRNGFPQEKADPILKRILAIDPQNTDKVKLAKQALGFIASMPGPSAAKQLRALTKQLNQLDHFKHPYAQGGAPIAFPGR